MTHPGSNYVGVDKWVSPPGVPFTAKKNLSFHKKKVTLLEGDSKDIVPRLDNKFTVVVVDGDHSYEGCYADLVNAWKKLRPGGVMICDDYAYPGLPGVPKAVDQFMAEKGNELLLLYKDVSIAFRKLT